MTARARFALRLAGVTAFGAVCVALFFGLFGLAGGDVRLSAPYHVQAVVPTAVALSDNADVRQAGIKIGKVAGIAPRGRNAVLTLDLDGGHAPVYRDATVRVRTKTLVGENYVDLDPGSPRAGGVPSGGTLPLDRAEQQVQLDQILSVLDAPTRRRLQTLLTGLGGGLAGHGGDLNDTLEGSAATVNYGAPLARVLSAQRADVAALVDNTGRVMQALADRRQALQTFAHQARATAEAAAAHERGFRATLRELPATLGQARATVAHLAGFSKHATPVLGDLGSALDRMTPAMRRLPSAASRTDQALRELKPFSAAARPLLASLRSFSGPGAAALPQVDVLLRELDPMLSYLAPYARDAGAFFADQRSALGAVDATGHLARVYGIVSRSTYASFTPDMRQAFDALAAAGAAGVSLGQGTNAYPAPGQIADPHQFAGRYPRVEADR